MSRQLTLCKVCNQLGLADDLSIDDDKIDEDVEFISLQYGDDDKEVAADDEGDIKVFEEIIKTQMMMEPQMMKM